MKNIIFLILDEFADWETAFLSTALNEKNITQNYSVSYASIDKNIITARGDSPVHFAKNVMTALGDIPQKNIQFFYDMYTIGFKKAFEKYSE